MESEGDEKQPVFFLSVFDSHLIRSWFPQPSLITVETKREDKHIKQRIISKRSKAIKTKTNRGGKGGHTTETEREQHIKQWQELAPYTKTNISNKSSVFWVVSASFPIKWGYRKRNTNAILDWIVSGSCPIRSWLALDSYLTSFRLGSESFLIRSWLVSDSCWLGA